MISKGSGTQSRKTNMQDKVRDLTTRIEDGVKELRSSDRYAELLRFQAKLPSYSFRNCLLLLQQTQGQATAVMGFEAWKKVGRHVKKGEHGLAIIAPTPYEIKTKEEKLDENGKKILSADGTAEMEEMVERRIGFKVTYVYDVAQTEGKELPSLTKRLQGDVKNYDHIMEAIERISPVPIYIEPVDGMANGYYSPVTRRIVVDSALEQKHKVHTAFHELGHAVLDDGGFDEGKEREEKEIEAESVSFVLLNHALGDEITPEEAGEYSFGYVSSYSSDDSLPEFKKLLGTIQKISCDLIQKYDEALEDVRLEHAEELAYQIKDGYLHIKKREGGYEYSVYDQSGNVLAASYLESDMRIDEAAKVVMKQEQKNVYDLKEVDIRHFENLLADEKTKRERLADDIKCCLADGGYVVSSEQILQELTGSTSKEKESLQKLLVMAQDGNEEALQLQARVEELFPYYKEETATLTASLSLSMK